MEEEEERQLHRRSGKTSRGVTSSSSSSTLSFASLSGKKAGRTRRKIQVQTLFIIGEHDKEVNSGSHAEFRLKWEF